METDFLVGGPEADIPSIQKSALRHRGLTKRRGGGFEREESRTPKPMI